MRSKCKKTEKSDSKCVEQNNLYCGDLSSSSWSLELNKTFSRLFIFVFGILLHTVGQTCLPREGGDFEEKIGVAVNTQGHQEGSDGIKQVGCHHRPECIIWDAEGSRGARMEGPPDVSPLALEGKTQERKQERTEPSSAQSLLFPDGRSFKTCCFPHASQRNDSKKSLNLPSTVINVTTKTHKE